jgi:methionyl-tRNA formyltransferase
VERAAVADSHGSEPGRLAVADGRLLFGAADGAIELLQVKPPGGRSMDAAAWLRGHPSVVARHNGGGG